MSTFAYSIRLGIVFVAVFFRSHAVVAQNDNFIDAIDLTGESLPYFGFSGISATAETAEPFHAGSPPEHSIWYSWDAPAGGGVYSIEEFSNMDDTRIGIYTGTKVATLTLVAEGTKRVFFNAEGGTSYKIAIDSLSSDSFRFLRFPDGGADDVKDAEVISGALPQSRMGNNVFATVGQDDEETSPVFPPRSTVWWRWIAPSSGAVRLDARRSWISPYILAYEQMPGATLERISAARFAMGFEVTAGNDYYFRFDQGLDGVGRIEFELDWIPTGAPPHDDLADARDLGNAHVVCDGGWMAFSSGENDAPNETAFIFGTSIPADNTIWWTWTCPESGFYQVSAFGSDVHPDFIYIYSGSEATSLDLVVNSTNGEFQPRQVRFMATAGTKYWIKFQDYIDGCVRAELNIHPAETETEYFELFERESRQLMGAERHPSADPDGDELDNMAELAFYGDPERHESTTDFNTLPHLEFIGGQWQLVWTENRNYTEDSEVPIAVVPETSSNSAGISWVPGTPVSIGGTSWRFPLPTGSGRGFGRVTLNDPNLSFPDP